MRVMTWAFPHLQHSGSGWKRQDRRTGLGTLPAVFITRGVIEWRLCMQILSTILVIHISIYCSANSHRVTVTMCPSCGQDLESWSWKLRAV